MTDCFNYIEILGIPGLIELSNMARIAISSTGLYKA